MKQIEYASSCHLSETPLHLELADALSECIERTQRIGVPLYLTGGVSAALMSHETWNEEVRPLSRDLDFLVPYTPEARSALEREYGKQFTLNRSKAVFKSDKLQAVASINGVELDFIASSNIVHEDASLSVTVTPFIAEHAQRENLFGVDVMTLHPALVAIQKLFAGRGKDLGKYDLHDASVLIESGRVDPQLFAAFTYHLTFESPGAPAVRTRLLSALSRLEQTDNTKQLQQALFGLAITTETSSMYQALSTALT